MTKTPKTPRQKLSALLKKTRSKSTPESKPKPTKPVKTHPKTQFKKSGSLIQWAVRIPTEKRDFLLQFIKEECGFHYGNGVRNQPNNRLFFEYLIEELADDDQFREDLKNRLIRKQKYNQLLGD